MTPPVLLGALGALGATRPESGTGSGLLPRASPVRRTVVCAFFLQNQRLASWPRGCPWVVARGNDPLKDPGGPLHVAQTSVSLLRCFDRAPLRRHAAVAR